MAEVTLETFYALALEVTARVERLDADLRDTQAEVRAMRAGSEAFCASSAGRFATVQPAY